MKSAILVIDLQIGLFTEQGKPFDYPQTIQHINSLTETARKHSVPVIYIQHEQTEGPLAYGSPGWELVHELTPEPTDYRVRKSTPNSFLRTNLVDILNGEEVTNLIICGYATEFCVDSTVRGGAALGYSIQLVADGHTTHDKPHASAERIRHHHNETLSNITSFGVSITAINAAELIQGMSEK